MPLDPAVMDKSFTRSGPHCLIWKMGTYLKQLLESIYSLDIVLGTGALLEDKIASMWLIFQARKKRKNEK